MVWKVYLLSLSNIKYFYRVVFILSDFEDIKYHICYSKAQGELLVSKGDTLASLVRRHVSTIVFSETAGQIYLTFGL
jgi:ribosome biogenesis SPOUT family RNA methylase Rps3